MTRISKLVSNNPFRYFNSSPEIMRLAIMLYVRYPLSLRNVEDLLFERGIDVCHETVRLWWNRFGPLFAADIRRQRIRLRTGAAPDTDVCGVFAGACSAGELGVRRSGGGRRIAVELVR